MTEWVRVKDPDTGHEITISTEQARAFNARVIESKDAAGTDGLPLPPKYHRTVDEAAAVSNKKGA